MSTAEASTKRGNRKNTSLEEVNIITLCGNYGDTDIHIKNHGKRKYFVRTGRTTRSPIFACLKKEKSTKNKGTSSETEGRLSKEKLYRDHGEGQRVRKLEIRVGNLGKQTRGTSKRKNLRRTRPSSVLPTVEKTWGGSFDVKGRVPPVDKEKKTYRHLSLDVL